MLRKFVRVILNCDPAILLNPEEIAQQFITSKHDGSAFYNI